MIRIAGWPGNFEETPGYNQQIDYEMVEVYYSEPITREQVKEYLRLRDTEDQDDLIDAIIVAARQGFEKASGLSLVPKAITLFFSNPEGMYPIPFGPLVHFDALYDNQGTAIAADNYTLIGARFPKLQSPLQCHMKAEYTVGFTTVPDDIKQALKDQCEFLFENRGTDSDTPALCPKAWVVAQRWSRTGFTT